MGLEAATHISDLVGTNPVSGDPRSQGDDHLRLLKNVLQTTLPNADKAFYFPDAVAKTANYSIVAADQNKLITGDATGGAFNLTLPALAAGDAGWQIWVVKIDSSANAVTVVGTINGAANVAITSQYVPIKILWSGSAWYAQRMLLADLNITGATALTDPAVADELAIYDASAAANRKITLANLLKIITGLTAETAPAVADELLLYDASAGTADKITLAVLFAVIDALTAEATPSDANDSIVIYDASATAARKMLLTNLFNAARTITSAWGFSNAAGVAAPNTVKAFGVVNGNALQTGSFGIASWSAAADQITLSSALPDTNYTVMVSAQGENNASIPSWEAVSTTVIQIGAFNSAIGVVDATDFSIMVLHNS